MMQKNKQRWLKLWQRVGAQTNPNKAYEDLITLYSQPHRAYHTLEHVIQCLDEFEPARHLATDPDTIEWAIWYHDVIYDTHAKDNEERSAEFAVEMAIKASLSENFAESVVNLIIETKHLETTTDPDTCLLLDVDLSILGQSRERFDEYEGQVRREYEWVESNQFVTGRMAVLSSFLKRPNIYATKFFRDKYEIKARQNIIYSLEKLSNRL